MLKFLRQYNKYLLAIFGSILLLTWLVPSAVTEFSRRSGAENATWATLGDGEVLTVARLQQAQRQLKVLEAMGVPLMASVGAENDPATWTLLVREARQAGFVGGVGEGQRVLTGMQSQTNAKPEEMLGRLCAASGMQPQGVLETLADLQGVARMLSMAMNAARMSDVRLEVKAAEAMSGVAADVVVISASQPLPQDDPAPTPERMESLLKEFGSVEPGKGRGGMGYRQPHRASIEWFSVPAASVRASLENDPALSGVALRKAFLRDPMRFGAPAGDATATFEAFKDKVREAELNRLVGERMEEISKFIGDQTQLALRRMEKDGVYAKLPADGSGAPSLAELSTAVASQFRIPDLKVERTDSMSMQDLAKVPGVGTSSTTRFGSRPMQLSEVVAQAREFKPDQVTAIVQAGVTGPTMRAQGAVGGLPADLYAFRIIETAPAHDARDLEEVRTALLEDAARVMRFEALERDRGSIETQAKAGMDSLASNYGTKVDFAPGIREADANLLKYGLKVPTALPTIGTDAAVSQQIVQRALAMPQDLSQVPDADRTFVVASPDKMALVAVKVREVFPVSREDYQDAASNPRFRSSLVGDAQAAENLRKSFGADAIKGRSGFKPAREDQAEDQASADKAPAKAG
jgi:hypothetical protein